MHRCTIWAENFGSNFTQCVNDISNIMCAYYGWACFHASRYEVVNLVMDFLGLNFEPSITKVIDKVPETEAQFG